MEVILLVVILIGIGFAAWVIERAPMISASIKPFIIWLLMVIGGALVFLWLLSLIGYGPGLNLDL